MAARPSARASAARRVLRLQQKLGRRELAGGRRGLQVLHLRFGRDLLERLVGQIGQRVGPGEQRRGRVRVALADDADADTNARVQRVHVERGQIHELALERSQLVLVLNLRLLGDQAFLFESDVCSRWPLSFARTTRNLAAALDSGPTELVGGSFGGFAVPKICECGSLVMIELMACFDEIAACALEIAPAGSATNDCVD